MLLLLSSSLTVVVHLSNYSAHRIVLTSTEVFTFKVKQYPSDTTMRRGVRVPTKLCVIKYSKSGVAIKRFYLQAKVGPWFLVILEFIRYTVPSKVS